MRYWDAEVCKNSRILNSQIKGTSNIWESDIRISDILNSRIVKSSVINSRIFQGDIIAAHIHDSCIDGNVIIQGTREYKVIIENSIIDHNVIIKGKVEIRNIVLFKMMRLEFGIWCRQPRYFEVENERTIFGVTESIDSKVFVGCQEFDMVKLIKGQKRFQKVIGFSDAVIKRMADTFTEWLDYPAAIN